MSTISKKFKLRIKRLSFISAVDAGAQGEISNVALMKRAPDGIEATCQVAKVDEKLGLVFGWACASSLDGGATEHVDFQDDVVETNSDDFIKAAAEFMESGAASDVMHSESPDGRVVFAMPLVPEVNAALGIDSNVHGLAIAMKPSAETFKRFASGELKAFSIGGFGSRERVEDLEKAHVGAPDAARKAQAEFDAAVAKQNADEEYVSKMVSEIDRHLDEFEKQHGLSRAVSLATVNQESIGKWGEVWLTKHALRIAKWIEGGRPNTVEAVEKRSPEQIVKANIDTIQKSLAAYTAAEAVYYAAGNRREFLDTPQGRELYTSYTTAQARAQGDVEGAVRPFNETIERLTKEVDALIEEHALRHNIARTAAEIALENISTTYRAKMAELRQAYTDRALAADHAVMVASRTILDITTKHHTDELAAAQKRATDAANGRKLPAEVAMDERADELARSRGKGFTEAYGWAVENDPTMKSLHKVYNAEFAKRVGGHQH